MGIPLGVIFCFSLAAFKKMTIVKIYLGISLEQLRAEWGQFSFRELLVPACTSRALHKGTDSVGPAFCALRRSKQLR